MSCHYWQGPLTRRTYTDISHTHWCASVEITIMLSSRDYSSAPAGASQAPYYSTLHRDKRGLSFQWVVAFRSGELHNIKLNWNCASAGMTYEVCSNVKGKVWTACKQSLCESKLLNMNCPVQCPDRRTPKLRVTPGSTPRIRYINDGVWPVVTRSFYVLRSGHSSPFKMFISIQVWYINHYNSARSNQSKLLMPIYPYKILQL
jgi:hypothetical protein